MLSPVELEMDLYGVGGITDETNGAICVKNVTVFLGNAGTLLEYS